MGLISTFRTSTRATLVGYLFAVNGYPGRPSEKEKPGRQRQPSLAQFAEIANDLKK
jgi:hypothetical protein